MSSKYDSAQVLITTHGINNNSTKSGSTKIDEDLETHSSSSSSSSSSYVLSRLAVARLLAFVDIDPITANRVALSVKKALVDANELQISHRHLFQKVLEILVKNFEIRLSDPDARLLAQYWRARPLVVVIIKQPQKVIITGNNNINNDNTAILLSVSQRLCDAAILDSNLLLQVDDIVTGLFSSPPTTKTKSENTNDVSNDREPEENEDLQYRRRSVTGAIAAESCRAFSRGGALVVGGPSEYFDSSEIILNEMRVALKGSFASSAASPLVIPGCVLFAELTSSTDASAERDGEKATSKRSSLLFPLSGNCLEVGIQSKIEQKNRGDHEDEDNNEQVAKKLVSYIRESLAETL